MEEFGKIDLTGQQLDSLETPCYIINETKLEENLKILTEVQKKAGIKIILALKGFAFWNKASLISKYLPGTTASSLHELKLGYDEFGGEAHIYSPAYKDSEFDEIAKMADHISFNSIAQWNKFKNICKEKRIDAGLRINPEHSEVATAIYDPSAPFSRLGVTLDTFTANIETLEGISGLHIHNLCQNNSDALQRTLRAIEKKFGFYLNKLSWINLGGGHHITRHDYDISLLINELKNFREKYNIDIYLEPGEAVGLNTGILVSEVLDIFNNGKNIAILDTSAAAHMPDVIEMPYRPEIKDAEKENILPYSYRLGGNTCLAGDVIGDYSFNKELQIGDKLFFGDMAIYTMVKNTTFNGIKLPTIYSFNSDKGTLEKVKEFGYNDFKERLS